MSDTACFLEAAARIGACLRHDAWWNDGRCNWIGHAPEEALPGRPSTVAPLGQDLYGGTAGVALFLAELAGVSGEAALVRTVEGALAHAWSRLDDIAPPSRVSLYSGWTGIAYAFVRAGLVLERTDWIERGKGLALRVVREPVADSPLDVVAGTAGAVLALLALDRFAPTPDFVDGAITLAEALAARAIGDGETLSWDPKRASGSEMGRVPATGFAHGTSGMALALLEVAKRALHDNLRHAADAAFRYERRWFDAKKENWPDLRSYDPQRPREEQTLAYGNAWCHGAPGIGLARWRALALSPGDEGLRRDAEAAARTTRKQFDLYAQGARMDLTPCHGLAGLTEGLLASQSVLDGDPRTAVFELWARLVARHAAADDWPSGLPSTNKVPSLMLGTAGVGHSLLRLVEPKQVPSILLIGASLH